MWTETDPRAILAPLGSCRQSKGLKMGEHGCAAVLPGHQPWVELGYKQQRLVVYGSQERSHHL